MAKSKVDDSVDIEEDELEESPDDVDAPEDLDDDWEPEEVDELEDDIDDELGDDEDDDEDDEDEDDEETEALDELESEELDMLTEDEESETLVVDEAAELRKLRRAEISLQDDSPGEPTEDEFVCSSCFLVKRSSQLAVKSKKLCKDCAG